MTPIPTDRAFWCVDAYGEIQRVRSTDFWREPCVTIEDSDGESFPVSDILDWDDNLHSLAIRNEEAA